MNANIILYSLLICCLSTFTAFAQQTSSLRGYVGNNQNQPLQFANVFSETTNSTVFTNKDGEFTLSLPATVEVAVLKISMVGKKTIYLNIPKRDFANTINLRMSDLSYTLEEVAINPVQQYTVNSNSSIVFDEEAIERVQAFSLMDVLKTLPSKASTAPTIDKPQTLTLRGNLGSSHDMNNSLGIPIIMDGVTLSNDANMQSRSSSQFGMGSAGLSGAKGFSGGDVPFQGIDLRDIPVETIEKIEVIQGVASAQYGELTDGAILIERKAGLTPWQVTTNINGGSSNFSLNKGLRLGQRMGALNVGLNYAISNPDPRDHVKQYDRISSALMWSTTWSKAIKNTLSLDVSKNLDEVKLDPDDDTQQRSYSKNNSFRISNRLNWRLNKAWARSINSTVSYSQSNQDSYKQWLLNSSPRGYAYKDTTGIYEGVVLSGRYLAEEKIVGKPITATAQVNATTHFHLGSNLHNISYGFSANYSNNGGKGIIADPDRPRWVNQGGQNARPYPFEYLDPLINYGIYVSDNFTSTVGTKLLTSNLGVRLDQQNGSWTLQPRLSSRLAWNSKLDFSLAFGVASKSPTMAHRYPAPTFLDIPLILSFNSYDALYLVYTQKIMPDNSQLKAVKSYQLEGNVRYKHSWFTASMNMFWKANRGGFNSYKTLKTIEVPEYSYAFNPQTNKIDYQTTGNMITFRNYGDYKILNIQNSNTIGADLIVNSKPIAALNTSINFSTSITRSSEKPDFFDVEALTSPLLINGQNIWYVIYEPSSMNVNTSILSKLGTTTHIPQLGFIVSANLDIFWAESRNSKYTDKMQTPIGYQDADGHSFTFPEGMENLPARDLSMDLSDQPFVYTSINLSVAKEIKKKFRIAVTLYNALNIQPEELLYSSSDTQNFTVRRFNEPLSITGGITYKF